MVVDLSTVKMATQEQFINIAHAEIGVPAIIIFLILSLGAFWIASFVFSHEKKFSWKTTRKTFYVFTILMLVIGGLLYFLPQLTALISSEVIKFFVGSP